MVSARFVDFGVTDSLTSQAAYHGLARAMEAGDDPVLDVVRPAEQYVCIGAHQELEKEVDVDFAESAGLPIYRRHVGGGTVLLDDGQLFWHFVLPKGSVAQGAVDDLFERFTRPAIDAYQALGIDAQYAPVNDIVANGKKIGGTGAGDIGDATVVVGSFMLEFDVETMAEVVTAPSEKFADKMYETLQQNMTTMKQELGEVPPEAEIVGAFREAIEDRLDWELRDDDPTPAEETAIDAAREELRDDDWLHRKGLSSGREGTKIKEGTHVGEGRHKAEGGLLRATVVAADGTLEDLVLSGDIQVLPESGLADLAADLTGQPLEEAAIREAAADSIDERSIQLPGVGPEDVATAVMAGVGGD